MRHSPLFAAIILKGRMLDAIKPGVSDFQKGFTDFNEGIQPLLDGFFQRNEPLGFINADCLDGMFAHFSPFHHSAGRFCASPISARSWSRIVLE